MEGNIPLILDRMIGHPVLARTYSATASATAASSAGPC